MNNGMFIVLEGCEGSGKSTQIKLLAKKLEKIGEVVVTREPGGTHAGTKIRELLMNSKMEISVLTELFLFCADRANHIDMLIRPALTEGKIVVCDRFDASTIAYQVYGRSHENFEEVFMKINAFAKGKDIYGEINPDMVILLDIDVEEGLRRARGRKEEKTKFDKEESEFHTKVRKAYLKQADINNNWFVINANLSIEEVERQIWDTVKTFGMLTVTEEA